MNCTQCLEHLAGLFDTPNDGVAISEHIAQCPDCASRIQEARALHARLTDRAGRLNVTADFTEATMQACAAATPDQAATNPVPARRTAYQIWRWLPAAAAALLVIAFLIPYAQSPRVARAEDVLKDGSAALSNITAMHIRARMRVSPGDNLGNIDLSADFTPIDIWTRTMPGPDSTMRWRVEKAARIMAMDGKATYIYLPGVQMAVQMRPFAPKESGDLDWLAGMLEPQDVLENELKAARTNASDYTVSNQTAGGQEFSVVTVESKAQMKGKTQGDAWLKNKTIWTSDTRRVYRFDAQTSRLAGVQIFVHAEPGKDVLVFETTQVEYPDTLADSLFTIDLPRGVTWQDMRKGPSAKDVPASCASDKKPEEVARAFFEAMATGNSDALNPFMMVKMKFPDQMLAAMKGLTILSIGKPFHSTGNTRQWFVPYEIQFAGGDTKSFNLAVRNDNPIGRWYVDGGF